MPTARQPAWPPRSEAFGPLTSNAGKIVMHDGVITLSLDIRYPDSTTSEELEQRLGALAAERGASFEVASVKPPFSVSADHPAVQALLDVYREVTGEEAEPFSMGRRHVRAELPLRGLVRAGGRHSGFPEWVGPMHGANEGANEAELRRALKIYILALVWLMELDL